MHEFLLHLGQLSWASISRSLSRMELVSIQLSPCLNHELLSGRVLLCYTLEKPERLCSQVRRWAVASSSHLHFSFCLVHTHEIGKVLKKKSERSKNVSFPFSVDCVSGFLFPSV